jgi:aspartate aminotransferase
MMHSNVEPPDARLAVRVGALRGEGAFEVARRTQTLAASGRDVISLAIGEPDFPTPTEIVEAAVRALRDGDTRYGPPEGLAELRDAIAQSHGGAGHSVHASQVVVTPGAKPALAYAILCLVAQGDEVLVPDPGFPIYAALVRFAGGVPVPYVVRPHGDPLPDDLALARLSPRARLVIVNSPHNPTGAVASTAGLARLAAAVERHDLTVISDEVYARLLHAPDDDDAAAPRRAPSIRAVPGLASRTVVIDGFSKAFAMTGWRLGYGLFPRPLARAAGLLATNVHSCVPAFVQRAGLAALEAGDAAVRAHRAELRCRRDAALQALSGIPGLTCAEPLGAFYAFPEVRGALRTRGETTEELCDRLLREQGVAVLPGSAFGANGAEFVRLALTVSSVRLLEAIERLRSVLAQAPPNSVGWRAGRGRSVSSGGAA